jgi:hypothetical protein
MEEAHLPWRFLIVSFPELPSFKICANDENYDIQFNVHTPSNLPSQFSVIHFLAL